MKKEDISLYDWQRILFGEVPASFYLEILIRAAVVYLILVIAMRLMGRRMSAKLSRNEMAAMVSLAAAIGVPILDPSRGLLLAVIIALVVVFTQRIVSYWAAKNQRFEASSQGDNRILVQDAVMLLDNMEESRVSRQLLFAELRSSGLMHMGQVKRLYMEANGAFMLIRETDPQPGLSVLPTWDEEFLNEQKRVVDQPVCNHCGNRQPDDTAKDKDEPCGNCGHREWVSALA